jgi:hypothetical protein
LIDDFLRVSALLAGLEGALPLHAEPLAELATVMRQDLPGRPLPRQWRVTQVSYAGDPGGIMCRLEEESVDRSFVVSITQLRFNARTPMAREIAVYQKHRSKRLRKMGVPKAPLVERTGP